MTVRLTPDCLVTCALRPYASVARHILLKIIRIGLFILVASFFASSARAQTPTDKAPTEEAPPNDARERAQLEKIERELAARKREEARLKDQAKARAREVQALRRRMVETANALQDAERRIAEINRELKRLEGEEEEVSANLTFEQNTLGDVLGALQSLERSRPPALLVSPDDAAGAARTAMLLADAAPTLEARAAQLRTSLERLTQIQTDLAAERARAEQTNAEIGDRRRVLADSLRDKQRERDVAARLAAAAQSETAALAARASTLSDVITRLERLARSITPRIKPAPPSRSPATPETPANPTNRRGPVIKFKPAQAFSKAQGKLRSPVVGQLVGQFGGSRPEGGQFDGVRYAAASNAIVTAPFEGNVAFARSWDPIGNLIVLDVGEGYHILLMGVGVFLVDEGQSVSAGEPIATMTEGATELDLEIRKNREPINPLLWLGGKTGG